MDAIITPPNFEQLRSEMNSESDRTVIIVSYAALEDALREAVKSCFPNADAVATLFGRDRPLESGSNCNHIALGIGLYHADMHREISLIRDMRHLCAHEVALPNPQRQPEIISFQHQTIQEKCTALKIPELMAQESNSLTSDLSAGERFNYSSAFIIGWLVLVPQLKTMRPRVSPPRKKLWPFSL